MIFLHRPVSCPPPMFVCGPSLHPAVASRGHVSWPLPCHTSLRVCYVLQKTSWLPTPFRAVWKVAQVVGGVDPNRPSLVVVVVMTKVAEVKNALRGRKVLTRKKGRLKVTSRRVALLGGPRPLFIPNESCTQVHFLMLCALVFSLLSPPPVSVLLSLCVPMCMKEGANWHEFSLASARGDAARILSCPATLQRTGRHLALISPCLEEGKSRKGNAAS